MALVPDGAVARMAELKPTAFNLYVYFCRWRDHTTGLVWREAGDIEAIHRSTGINRTYLSTLKGELRTKQWIAQEGDRIRPLVGDFNVGARRSEYPKDASKFSSPGSEIPSDYSKFSSPDSNIPSGSNKDVQRTSSTIQHPHSTAAPDRGREGSRFTESEVLAWAEAEAKRDPSIRSARALGMARLADGKADALVEAFLNPAPAPREEDNPLLKIPLEHCPDCHGAMFEVTDKGARKCKHPRLLETWIQNNLAAAPESATA